MPQNHWKSSRLLRQLVCSVIALISSVPFGIAVGVAAGLGYVEIEHVSSFEGGVGLTVMYITYATVPIVAIVNVAIHLSLSAETWPKRLLVIDALAVLLLLPMAWFLLMV